MAERCLIKAIEKGLTDVNLGSLKLRRIPNLENLASELTHLSTINLSKNNLFDGDVVFSVSLILPFSKDCHNIIVIQALSQLSNLRNLNLSENFLNGMLSEYAGNLFNIEVINLDVNNITALCPAVRNWTKLKTFTISDNSLTGESVRSFAP